MPLSKKSGRYVDQVTEEDIQIALTELNQLKQQALEGNLDAIALYAQSYRNGLFLLPIDLERAAEIDLKGALLGNRACQSRVYEYMLSALLIESASNTPSSLQKIKDFNETLVDNGGNQKLSAVIREILRVEQNEVLPDTELQDCSEIAGLAELFLWWMIVNKQCAIQRKIKLDALVRNTFLYNAVDWYKIEDTISHKERHKLRLFDRFFFRGEISSCVIDYDDFLTDGDTKQLCKWGLTKTFRAQAMKHWNGFNKIGSVKKSPSDRVANFWHHYYAAKNELGTDYLVEEEDLLPMHYAYVYDRSYTIDEVMYALVSTLVTDDDLARNRVIDGLRYLLYEEFEE